MTRKLILTVILSFLPFTAFAVSYYVHDADGPDAYILRQPTPGLFLGAMVRQLNLDPDWTNRQWIQLIHRANPDQVDPKGEILSHDQELRFPLAALKRLKGYQNLENYFTSVKPESLVTEPAQASAQDVIEPQPEPIEAPVDPNPAPVIAEDSQDSSSTYRFDILIGGGVEDLKIDNGLGSDASLASAANFAGLLGFKTQFSENHQVHFSALFQYKNYLAPPSVNVVEDLNFLLDFKYGYGYRLFNNVFIRLLGESQQLNFAQYRGAIIDLHTIWVHSLGLQLDSPLFDVGYKQVSFELAGLYALPPQSDFDIDPGYRLGIALKLEPQNFEGGWMLTLQGNYHNQIPSNFSSHSALEGMGLIGYSF